MGQSLAGLLVLVTDVASLERDELARIDVGFTNQWILIQNADWNGGQHMMGRPYSIDLRERAVVALEKRGMSRRQAAAQFGGGVSTVIAWVRLFRKTGNVAPGKMGGQPARRARSKP
jgi:Homeodomain-like domain